MALEYVSEGSNMFGFIEVSTNKIRLNCINKISLKFDTDENEIVCDGFDGFKTYLPSLKSAMITISGIYRKATGDDAATNFGWEEFFASQKAQTTEKLWVCPNTTTGTKAIYVTGFVKSSSLDLESKKPTPYQIEMRVTTEPSIVTFS
jgi:hypothetical protein